MTMYKIDKNCLNYIEEDKFKLEKEIQDICESNLSTLLNLQFVTKEFACQQFRIDSLAFDKVQKSFVIIEYKRDKNFSVVDQGYAYLALMLNHKSDFVLEYNETINSKTPLPRDDVDWTQSKVIFIAPSFTAYQKEAINFKDLPIDLFEIKRYKNNTLSLIKINSSKSTESIKSLQKSDANINKVNSEIIVYTESDHLTGNKNKDIIELYQQLKSCIVNLNEDISINPTKVYISFKNQKIICDVAILKSTIKIWLNIKFFDLKDPARIVRDVSEVGHHGNGNCEVIIKDDSNIEYVMGLIKQVCNTK